MSGNFFSSPTFLEAAGQDFFAGRRWRPTEVEVEGLVFGVLDVTGRIQPGLPFADFLEPLRERAARRRAGFLPRVAHDRVPLAAWQAEPQGMSPAPLVQWSEFSSFEEFKKLASQRSSRAFVTPQRKERKLGREVGEVRFEWNASDPKLLARCMQWKSAQYRRTGGVDLFAWPKARGLFELLFERGALTVSAVFVADRPVAIHLGAVHDQRFYYWIPAYDTELQQYSPGAIMLEKMLETSYRQGHREFDFLIGGEEYKFYYATHVRRIGRLGTPPLLRQMWEGTRRRLIVHVRRRPQLYGMLQRCKRTALQQRLSR